jgi:hypothetical protein
MFRQQKQNSIQDFLTEQNVNMLLEIIMDEDIMRVQPTEVIKATSAVFYNNIRGFYENEKDNTNGLIEMNKQYIMLMLRHVKSDLIKKPEKRQPHVTFEDIQSVRRSQFDKDLSARQSDFTSAMTPPVPPVPKFSDAAQDEHLSELELAIKQMTEQRNYDVEQITNNFKSNNMSPPLENNDKFKKPLIKQTPGIRYIKIENVEAKIDDASIVDLSNKSDDIDRNIFSKLKKVDDTTILMNLQNEVKELGAKLDSINQCIIKILGMLSIHI